MNNKRYMTPVFIQAGKVSSLCSDRPQRDSESLCARWPEEQVHSFLTLPLNDNCSYSSYLQHGQMFIKARCFSNAGFGKGLVNVSATISPVSQYSI